MSSPSSSAMRVHRMIIKRYSTISGLFPSSAAARTPAKRTFATDAKPASQSTEEAPTDTSSDSSWNEEPRYTHFLGPGIDKPFFLAVGLSAYFLFHDRARQQRGEDGFKERLDRQIARWHRNGLEIPLPYIGNVTVIRPSETQRVERTVAAVVVEPEPVVVVAVPAEPEKPKVTVEDVVLDPKEVDQILKAMSEAVQDPQQQYRK